MITDTMVEDIFPPGLKHRSFKLPTLPHLHRHRYEPWKSHQTHGGVFFSAMCMRCGRNKRRTRLWRWN